MKPALVLLPGAGGRVDLLQQVAARLTCGGAATVCSYPGLGGAPPAPGLDTLADLQRHVLTGLPARFDLVAKSMGSVLALRLALAHPERVRRLVLLATTGGIDVAVHGAAAWREGFVRAFPAAPTWFVDDRTDLGDRLAELLQPTLLIFGDADALAPVAVGQSLLERLPRARLEVIAGATHDLEAEFPERIAVLIDAHLRG